MTLGYTISFPGGFASQKRYRGKESHNINSLLYFFSLKGSESYDGRIYSIVFE